MSCDLAAAAFLFLASAGPSPAAVQVPASVSVAREPLYADIVARAGALKAQVGALAKPAADPAAPAAALELEALDAAVGELAALDMKGHEDLKARGVDGDLKCILRGIAQDLPKRLAEVKAATTAVSQQAALKEMVYLLNDNVEVITAPPAPPV